MSSPEERDKQLDRLERELKARETELRLQQIESQMQNQEEAKFYPTRKYQPQQQEKGFQRWKPKVILGLKLFGLGVVALVAVRVASVVAGLLIIAALGFAAYQLFLKKTRSQ